MKQMNVEVLDRGENCGLKRKRDSAVNFTNANKREVAHLPIEAQSSLRDASRTDCRSYPVCHTESYILKNFCNFSISGLPQRVMSYEYGKWSDFPENIVSLVRIDFQSKRAITEAVYQNQQILLDFTHMVCVIWQTSLVKPLAWIDDYGKCFFPVLDSEKCASNKCNHYEKEKVAHVSPNRMHETDEHNGISISAAESSSSRPDDEIISCVKRIKTDENSVNDQKLSTEVNPTVGDNEPGSVYPSNIPAFGSSQIHSFGQHASRVVQDMLLQGLGKIVDAKDIVGILKTPIKNYLGEFRFNVFQKQVEITKNIRGNANVRSAWLASSKEAVEDMMTRGVLKKPIQTHLYNGILLTPANSSDIS